ncbi:MAG TPA: multicopper oxidase domain-containing protein [Anaeromyxobacteraceae bacterium]|nr:multicopper oxidase domain-containing protein [Anaeromyxobacteraceae bacterium]
MYLPWKTSRNRLREAEGARRNRAEVIRAWSSGQLTRRELVKLGLMTAAGSWVLKNGLSPLAPSAYAAVPTGTPPSPIPPGLAFTQPMPRLGEFQRKKLGELTPAPTRESNQTFNAAKGVGPIEGRPPGPLWAHQRWEEFFPRVAIETSMMPVVPGVTFHPQLPVIAPERFWTFDGTPFKLVKARYGEPLLFRHHNRLDVDAAKNGGFGRNTITTHHHNGHTPAESDGFAGAFFFPGQFYDYRWPFAYAGTDTINTAATDPRCGMPTDSGGILKLPGDWRETESTMWFHDHMVDFTSQNVYKGNAAMLNLYSAVDRGNEEIADGVNFRLPSGNAAAWGNTDYDVNLLLADKALDQTGQMFFDIFNFDGFIGDFMTVNAAYKPYLEVERRKYRFRILNGCVSRFFKIQLSDGSPFWWIANDGNLMERPLLVTTLDEQGIAERYDIVVDFSKYNVGDKVWLVNCCEHQDGLKPSKMLDVASAQSGGSPDPCVGRFLELRIARDPPKPDVSQVPNALIPLPTRVPVVRERTFEFGRGGGGTDGAPWTIKVNAGSGLSADVSRISSAPKPGTAEIWHLRNGGGGWDHPVHIHFEEGQTLSRTNGVPEWERIARKDVWRLRPSGEVSVYLQFREFSGTYVEHCHNTTHEDHAMLLRWDVNGGPTPLPTPMPTPAGVTFIDSSVLPEGK